MAGDPQLSGLSITLGSGTPHSRQGMLSHAMKCVPLPALMTVWNKEVEQDGLCLLPVSALNNVKVSAERFQMHQQGDVALHRMQTFTESMLGYI